MIIQLSTDTDKTLPKAYRLLIFGLHKKELSEHYEYNF